MMSIEELYSKFEKKCIPEDAGENQRYDMKMAFYAGAHGLFTLMTEASTTMTEDEAMKYFDKVEEEFNQYISNLQAQSKTYIQ